MNTLPQKATQGWRWALIAAEVIVAGYFATSILAGRSRVGLDVGAPLSVLVFVAWLFLFLGSPFLVRSQKWLAILGWCIAAGVLLFPAL